ncbi:hypothetical protein D9M68_620310 [compost metagenome]
MSHPIHRRRRWFRIAVIGVNRNYPESRGNFLCDQKLPTDLQVLAQDRLRHVQRLLVLGGDAAAVSTALRYWEMAISRPTCATSRFAWLAPKSKIGRVIWGVIDQAREASLNKFDRPVLARPNEPVDFDAAEPGLRARGIRLSGRSAPLAGPAPGAADDGHQGGSGRGLNDSGLWFSGKCRNGQPPSAWGFHEPKNQMTFSDSAGLVPRPSGSRPD